MSGLRNEYSKRLREGRTSLLIPYNYKRTPSNTYETLNTFNLEEEYGGTKSDAFFNPSSRSRTNYVYNFENKVNDKRTLLIPITIELNVGEYKLNDTFLWNFNESFITPDKFAEILCDDLDLRKADYMQQITDIITSQIDDYRVVYLEEQSLLLNKNNVDSTVPIKLDINIFDVHLKDQFEWNTTEIMEPLPYDTIQTSVRWPKVSEEEITPEKFAKQLCSESGLSGEFQTRISVAIRDQIYQYKKAKISAKELVGEAALNDIKSLLELERTNGLKLDNPFIDLLKSHRPDKVVKVVRDYKEVDKWGPILQTLDDDEIELIRMESDKRSKQRRRGGLYRRSKRT